MMMSPYTIADTFSWQWISSYAFIGLYNQAIRFFQNAIILTSLHDITCESQWHHRWHTCICKYAYTHLYCEYQEFIVVWA